MARSEYAPAQRAHAQNPVAFAAAVLVVLAAPAWFVLEERWLGAVLLAAGLAIAWAIGRRRPRGGAGAGVGAGVGGQPSLGSEAAREPSLLRDLSLIAVGLAIIRTIPLAAQLDTLSMVRFTAALGGAVLIPYLLSRFLYRDRAIAFPWRGARDGSGRLHWGRWHWGWLIAVIGLAWLILPWYFISTGVYQNWPAITDSNLIVRLFIGVGAVGIWDELFFICIVFAALRRHFTDGIANVLQAVVFVSFLWELGYRSFGPLLTIPFALVQGFIFLRTRSLTYVVTVHLLFDAAVFAVLVHAHVPELFDIFLVSR